MKETIILKAISLFNKYGIQEIGVRELARVLEISPGNVSYYFPSKDDLIIEIFNRFEKANSVLLNQALNSVKKDDATVMKYLKQGMLLQHDFRCLFISYSSIIAIPVLGRRVAEVDKNRKQILLGILQELRSSGFLKETLDDAQLEIICKQILLLIRFRFIDAQIVGRPISRLHFTQYYYDEIIKFLELFMARKSKRD